MSKIDLVHESSKLNSWLFKRNKTEGDMMKILCCMFMIHHSLRIKDRGEPNLGTNKKYVKISSIQFPPAPNPYQPPRIFVELGAMFFSSTGPTRFSRGSHVEHSPHSEVNMWLQHVWGEVRNGRAANYTYEPPTSWKGSSCSYVSFCIYSKLKVLTTQKFEGLL